MAPLRFNCIGNEGERELVTIPCHDDDDDEGDKMQLLQITHISLSLAEEATVWTGGRRCRGHIIINTM